MTPESKVKAEIKTYLESIGVYYFMPFGSAYGRRGVPDFIVCHQGRFVGIEAKSETGTATKWQDKEIAAIRAAGGIALVARGAGAVEVVRAALHG